MNHSKGQVLNRNTGNARRYLVKSWAVGLAKNLKDRSMLQRAIDHGRQNDDHNFRSWVIACSYVLAKGMESIIYIYILFTHTRLMKGHSSI